MTTFRIDKSSLKPRSDEVCDFKYDDVFAKRELGTRPPVLWVVHCSLLPKRWVAATSNELVDYHKVMALFLRHEVVLPFKTAEEWTTVLADAMADMVRRYAIVVDEPLGAP